ncbi:hypothetical protein VmeM32_00217 [Vibrio phage vB_VmeM-32]|nr:hypothetical protein VmeM32_00217 [Vibrio phage vB_VmeM-32]
MKNFNEIKHALSVDYAERLHFFNKMQSSVSTEYMVDIDELVSIVLDSRSYAEAYHKTKSIGARNILTKLFDKELKICHH